MHALRKNRHWVSGLLLPVLMVIWLSVTCQACFASEQPVAMNDHDCCPGMKTGHDHGVHQHDNAKACKISCTIHDSQQKDIHDGFALEKLVLPLATLSESFGSLVLVRDDPGVFPLRIEPVYSPPVFENYRILLI